MWRAPQGLVGLAAVPVGGGGAWPGFETTYKHTSAPQPHWCGGRRRDRRARPGFETTRRAKLAARTTRGRAAAHRHTQRPGPPAPGTPAEPQATTGSTHTRTHPFGHNKTARPQWGRAAVAVALGFEPRVAVTPHSISSAAPSAARTRYLTRILYYMDPHRAQIDREVWDQGHTTSQDHTAARNTGTTSAFRTVENTIK